MRPTTKLNTPFVIFKTCRREAATETQTLLQHNNTEWFSTRFHGNQWDTTFYTDISHEIKRHACSSSHGIAKNLRRPFATGTAHTRSEAPSQYAAEVSRGARNANTRNKKCAPSFVRKPWERRPVGACGRSRQAVAATPVTVPRLFLGGKRTSLLKRRCTFL
jgi:hypothetical protein